MKVHLSPWYDAELPDRAEGGIRRVVEAMIRYMPEHGVTYTRELADADLAVGHGVIARRLPGQPFISHCHGLHWAEYRWPNWAHEVNGLVIDALVQAQAVTVPSLWVRDALVRSVLRRPVVIHHGVEPEEWKPSPQHGEYVLWNKARADPVSDPADLQKIALRVPELHFLSTVGTGLSNLDVIGVQPLPVLKEYIQKAGVYLATARETFGIGTLEAMSCGVPIAGWNYGGQSEIVVQGETGYLAAPGDYDGLAECVRRCLAERVRLGDNARADVLKRWTWPGRMLQYAQLYERVVNEHQRAGPRTTVVVPSYNLSLYLPEALDSVLAQTDPDWECIIVDDGSEDDSPTIAQEYASRDARFRYIRQDRNRGLSATRNTGALAATGRFLLFLDADDRLDPAAIGILAGSLADQPGLHIAYGSLAIIQQEGPSRLNEWPGPFDWRAQIAHINSIHTGAMMRREVWEETGGYRERFWRAEDAFFWTTTTSFGFRAAKVTSQPTLHYRLRSESKGQVESRTYPDRDGPWTEWFPWTLAHTAQEGHHVMQNGAMPSLPMLVPAGAQGKASINSGFAWDAPHHAHPGVSVIIPVGPGHAGHVLDALDSLIAQDVRGWEGIVVNDTGEVWDTVAGAPWARVVQTGGNKGAGAARNIGVEASRSQILMFLDADDWLKPGTIRRMLNEYVRGDISYLYGDYTRLEKDGRTEILSQLNDYRQDEWRMQNGIVVMMAKEHFQAVGGFDPDMPGYEEWDLFCKMAVQGYCGRHVAHQSFVYRYTEGKRREVSRKRKDELLGILKQRYGGFYVGGKKMTSCCGGGGDAILEARRVLADIERANMGLEPRGAESKPVDTGPKVVRMEFIGDRVGSVTYFGNNGRQYKGGNNAHDRFTDVVAEDVARLELTSVWKIVQRPVPKVRMTPIPPPTMEPAFPVLDRSAVEVGAEKPVPEVAVLEVASPFEPDPPPVVEVPSPEPVAKKSGWGGARVKGVSAKKPQAKKKVVG